MSVVLQIKDFKRGAVKRHDLEQSRYFCLRCDGDNFKLMSSGAIHCTGCTAKINNLRLMDIT